MKSDNPLSDVIPNAPPAAKVVPMYHDLWGTVSQLEANLKAAKALLLIAEQHSLGELGVAARAECAGRLRTMASHLDPYR